MNTKEYQIQSIVNSDRPRSINSLGQQLVDINNQHHLAWKQINFLEGSFIDSERVDVDVDEGLLLCRAHLVDCFVSIIWYSASERNDSNKNSVSMSRAVCAHRK